MWLILLSRDVFGLSYVLERELLVLFLPRELDQLQQEVEPPFQADSAYQGHSIALPISFRLCRVVRTAQRLRERVAACAAQRCDSLRPHSERLCAATIWPHA